MAPTGHRTIIMTRLMNLEMDKLCVDTILIAKT